MNRLPQGTELKVLVIEDDPFARTSISGALTNAGLNVVAAVGDARSAIYSFTMHDPDVIVADLDLGFGPTGIDLARSFRIRKPKLGIVVLTSYTDPRLLRNDIPVLPPGCEYLVKHHISEMQFVKTSVTKAFANVNSDVVVSTGTRTPDWIHDLTQVQIETLRMVAQGLSNVEIAHQRFVSEKAVEQTISKIAKALGIPVATNQNQRVHIARIFFRLAGQSH
jgi:DNA-binding NarL/FixJ family response regulator